MITILKNGNNISYGIQEFLLDTNEDFKLLSNYKLYPGSIATVIETSKKYIFSNSKEWKEFEPFYWDEDNNTNINYDNVWDGGLISSNDNITDSQDGGTLD